MEQQTIDLHSVDAYNKLYGLETLHPLVSVIDLTGATRVVNHITMHYGLYALFLKQGQSCEIRYGRKRYDYQEGTVVSFAPGQTVEVHTPQDEHHPKVYGVLFHPDLIRGTSLAAQMEQYRFFAYSSHEALHLSTRERAVFEECLEHIRQETLHPIDTHTKQLLASSIELLLGYCLRFYERQFVTRQLANQDVLAAFEQHLHEYWQSGEQGLPSVKYFADRAHLSANYFGDLIKKETGRSAQEHIQYLLIERAKDRIVSTHLTMSEIAYELGFTYPQHFGRLFKKQTGLTPKQYRTQA